MAFYNCRAILFANNIFFQMKIEICNSYEAISLRAKDEIVETLLLNKDLLVCTASGGSPTCLYKKLAGEALVRPQLFEQLRVVKLDEWGGVSMKYPGTCECYLQQEVIVPLLISADRYISFRSDADDPGKECERIQSRLAQQGPIDICILGLGMNGHIAFNEPSAFLQPHCHVATLSDSSMSHPMVAGEDQKPTYGLTLGMADILQSKKIIILINGAKKKGVTQEFLSAKITTALPASFLWLHPDVLCLIDSEAM